MLIEFFAENDVTDVRDADDSVIVAIGNVQDYIGDNCQAELD